MLTLIAELVGLSAEVLSEGLERDSGELLRYLPE